MFRAQCLRFESFYIAECRAAHAGLHSVFVEQHFAEKWNGECDVHRFFNHDASWCWKYVFAIHGSRTFIWNIAEAHRRHYFERYCRNECARNNNNWCFAWPHFARSRSIYKKVITHLADECEARVVRNLHKKWKYILQIHTKRWRSNRIVYLFFGFWIDFSPSSQRARIMWSSQNQHVPSLPPHDYQKSFFFVYIDFILGRQGTFMKNQCFVEWTPFGIGYREQLALNRANVDKSYLHICILYDLENFRIEVFAIWMSFGHHLYRFIWTLRIRITIKASCCNGHQLFYACFPFDMDEKNIWKYMAVEQWHISVI